MLTLTPTFDASCTTGSDTARTSATLSARERALAVLTTVFALEDHALIEQAVTCAEQAGVTSAEIDQTSTIVLAVQDVCKRYGLQGSPAWQ